MQPTKETSHIPFFPGMKMTDNLGSYGGINCSFENGWVATVSGQPSDAQYLVFISYEGRVRQITELISIEDQRENDEKRFLNGLELRNLLSAMSRFR